jgi:hypothetical protein
MQLRETTAGWLSDTTTYDRNSAVGKKKKTIVIITVVV